MTKITADHLGRGAFVYIRQSTALRIVQDLIGRRLADVDKGAAAQMFSRDLGHR